MDIYTAIHLHHPDPIPNSQPAPNQPPTYKYPAYTQPHLTNTQPQYWKRLLYLKDGAQSLKIVKLIITIFSPAFPIVPFQPFHAYRYQPTSALPEAP